MMMPSICSQLVTNLCNSFFAALKRLRSRRNPAYNDLSRGSTFHDEFSHEGAMAEDIFCRAGWVDEVPLRFNASYPGAVFDKAWQFATEPRVQYRNPDGRTDSVL